MRKLTIASIIIFGIILAGSAYATYDSYANHQHEGKLTEHGSAMFWNGIIGSGLSIGALIIIIDRNNSKQQ